MLSLAKQLIHIPSVSHDVAQLHKCIDFLQWEFGNAFDVHLKKLVHNGKPSLIVQNFVGKRADIVLNGHIDVVPPVSGDQFTPVEKDGKLYARGAGDMKAGVAIMVQIMKDLLQQGYADKKLMLMITSDEEVGGFDGVCQLVKDGYGGDIVIIPDGGSTDHIVTSQKGVYILTIAVTGQQAHSSRPWLGHNALHDLIAVYNSIKDELEDREKLYHSSDHRATSVNFNMIQSGNAMNIIPGEATGTIDIRFTEHHSLSYIKKIVEKALNGYNYTIKKTVTGNVLYTEPGDRDVQAYASITENIINKDIIFEKEHGGSDGRFFSELGSKVILHRPTCGSIHQKDERVAIDDLQKIYECYKQFILR